MQSRSVEKIFGGSIERVYCARSRLLLIFHIAPPSPLLSDLIVLVFRFLAFLHSELESCVCNRALLRLFDPKFEILNAGRDCIP